MKRKVKEFYRYLAARPSCKKLNIFLFECSLHGLGILNYQSESLSGEKNFIDNIVPRFFSPKSTPVFFDVGANIGRYSKSLIKKFPSAKIIAFEPNPKIFDILKTTFPDNIKCINSALGSTEGTIKFYDRYDRGGASTLGSLYKEVIECLHNAQSVEMEVCVTTLDSFAWNNNIDKINLLKIDTEGHELEVLRGAQKSLSDSQIDLIQIEFNEMNIVSRVFFHDFKKILSDYKAYRLLPSGVISLDEISPLKTELFAFQNIVFAHKNFQTDDELRPQKCN